MNIAIFGGTFDPPHIGHIEVIKKALETLDIERLYIVPAYLNPFKKDSFAPPQKRVEWIRGCIDNFVKTEVCEYEIAQNAPTPTIKTVRHIIDALHPDTIYLIIGADNLEGLSRWSEIETLKNLVEFVVAKRDDIEIPSGYRLLDTDIWVSSTAFRDGFDECLLPEPIRESVIKFFKERDEQKS